MEESLWALDYKLGIRGYLLSSGDRSGSRAQPPASYAEKQTRPRRHISQCRPDRLIKSDWCPSAREKGFIFPRFHPQGKKLRLMACACHSSLQLPLWWRLFAARQCNICKCDLEVHKRVSSKWFWAHSQSARGWESGVQVETLKYLNTGQSAAQFTGKSVSEQQFHVQISRCISPLWTLGGAGVLIKSVTWS